MYQWLGASPVIRDDRENQIGQNLPPIEEMLVQFEHIRHEEINLLSKFKEADWNFKRETTFWGNVSLFWLVSKTYQHTLEHTHDVLRLTLFWDRILERMTN